MVVPLQVDTALLGPPPPVVFKAMRGIRGCVVGMYVFTFFGLLQGPNLMVLADLVPAVLGTYLLRDDPLFSQCHRCLRSSSREGGLGCLPSFMVICGLNGASGFLLGLCRAQAMVFLDSLIHLAACATCCWAWKVMQRSRAALLGDAADVEHGHPMSNLAAGSLLAAPAAMQRDSEDDPALRLALEASMRGQSGSDAVLAESEEDSLLMQAVQQQQAAAMAGRSTDPEIERILRHSEAEEGRRIVQEQDVEYQEALAMDQAREAAEREAREKAKAEEQRLREEEERRRLEEAERLRLEEERKAEVARSIEEKRARLPSEPAAGEIGRVVLLFRLPSGRRCQRAFRSCDMVGSLYDFVDVEEPEMAENVYCLVSQVPRRCYNERGQTLEAACVENQSVILAEVD